MTTNFFTQLAEILQGSGATFQLSQDADKMTVSFLPQKKGGKSNLIPLNMTGEPKEFDEEFLSSISKAVDIASGKKGLVTNEEEFTESAEEAPAKKSAPSKKPAPEKKAAAPAKKAAAPAKKPEVKKPEPKPAKPAAVQTEIPVEPIKVEPAKHKAEDLEKFRKMIEEKLETAKDDHMFVKRMIEKGNSSFGAEELKRQQLMNNTIITKCEMSLKQIEEGIYGVREDALIPASELEADLFLTLKK